LTKRLLGKAFFALNLLIHNHPSGDPTPSAADIEGTRSLVQVAKPIGVSVRDHLVFGRDSVASFRARGLL